MEFDTHCHNSGDSGCLALVKYLGLFVFGGRIHANQSPPNSDQKHLVPTVRIPTQTQTKGIPRSNFTVIQFAHFNPSFYLETKNRTLT